MINRMTYPSEARWLLGVMLLLLALTFCGCAGGNRIVGKWERTSGAVSARQITFEHDGSVTYVFDSGSRDGGRYEIKPLQMEVRGYTTNERLPQFEKQVLTISFPDGRRFAFRVCFVGQELQLAGIVNEVLPFDGKMRPYQTVNDPGRFRRTGQ